MRKVLKTRTQFPNDDSVAKTLWLAILDAEEKRAEQRARQAGKPKAERDGIFARWILERLQPMQQVCHYRVPAPGRERGPQLGDLGNDPG